MVASGQAPQAIRFTGAMLLQTSSWWKVQFDVACTGHIAELPQLWCRLYLT